MDIDVNVFKLCRKHLLLLCGLHFFSQMGKRVAVGGADLFHRRSVGIVRLGNIVSNLF